LENAGEKVKVMGEDNKRAPMIATEIAGIIN
jgi:hypothetical protein